MFSSYKNIKPLKHYITIVNLSTFLFFTFFIGPEIIAQNVNIGTPTIHNYKPSNYQAGTQNWDISTSPSGILYAANNEGLLIFDGEKWSQFTQPNKTIARSLTIFNDNNILLGGQDELGLINPNKNGKLEYNSWRESIPKEFRDMEDIWDIEYVDSTIVFRNSYRVFVSKKEKFKVLHESENITMLTSYGRKVYYFDFYKGLYQFNIDAAPKKIIDGDQLIGSIVIDMVHINNKRHLILTKNNGVFLLDGIKITPWKNIAQDFFKKNIITSGIKLYNNNIAIGTRLAGLIILHPDGRPLYRIDKKIGLQNNSINCITEDQWHNIWLGTYYGIDKIDFSTGQQYFYPDGELEGAVYDIQLWNNQWWFGTSNGLYVLPYKDYYNPLEKNNFSFIENSKGQVWSLDIINDQLYMGHQKGAYKIDGEGKMKKIGHFEGSWKFIGLSDNKIAVGTYNGVYIIQFQNNKHKLLYKIENLNESSRVMALDKEKNLWVSHPYRGVFKIKFSENFTKHKVIKYPPSYGYENKLDNYIFDINSTPYLTNPNGIFYYDFEKDSFLKDTMLIQLLKASGRVRKFQTQGNDIWYIAEKETGLIQKETSGLKTKLNISRFPIHNNLFVGGFENMFPIDKENQFHCSNRGVVQYSSNNEENPNKLNVFISEITNLKTDSLFVAPKYINPNKLILSPTENSIRFSFRTNGKNKNEIAGYSYKLDGLEEEWSIFNTISFKEYTKIRHGTYRFLLKAMDLSGHETEPYGIEIEIEAPWHLTNAALLLYILAFSFFLLVLILIPRKIHKKTTAILVNKQKETEKIVEVVIEEKLKNEIHYKNRELANSTLHLLQKNQTLINLRTEMDKLQQSIKNEKVRNQLKKIYSIFRADMRIEEDWDNFSFYFNQVHDDYLKKLQSNYPQLSSNDLKLCAYLKMNLNTKEMAPLLNISVRGVEISRYRLRKKLQLDRTINLNEFMNEI